MWGFTPRLNPLNNVENAAAWQFSVQVFPPEIESLGDTSECPSVTILVSFHPQVTSLSCETVRSVSSDSHSMPRSGDVRCVKVRTTMKFTWHDFPFLWLVAEVHGQWVRWRRKWIDKISVTDSWQLLWYCENVNNAISTCLFDQWDNRVWLGEKNTWPWGDPKLNGVMFV